MDDHLTSKDRLLSRTQISQPYYEILKLVLKKWKFIVIFTIASALCSAIIVLLVPNKYTATTTLIPSLSDIDRKMQFLQFNDMSELGDLGLGLGDKSPLLIYNEILKSRYVSENVIKQTYAYKKRNKTYNQNLYEYFGTNNLDIAIRKLKEAANIEYDKRNSIITISVTTKNPDLSAQVANKYHQFLDYFNIYQRKSGAAKNREFIANRMAETKNELELAEEELKNFRANNLNYVHSSDPDLIMIHNRLQRDVELKNSKYLTLAQQYEYALIMEKKDIPIIQVLDAASPPQLKSSPARARTVFLGLMAGVLFSLALVYLEDRLKNTVRLWPDIEGDFIDKVKSKSLKLVGKG